MIEARESEAFSPDKQWELPTGWSWDRLEDVVTLHDGLRKPVKKGERQAGPIPYCGANGIIDRVTGFTHEGDFVLVAEDGGFYVQENGALIPLMESFGQIIMFIF